MSPPVVTKDSTVQYSTVQYSTVQYRDLTWAVCHKATKEECDNNTVICDPIAEYSVLEDGDCASAANPNMRSLTAHNHKVPST